MRKTSIVGVIALASVVKCARGEGVSESVTVASPACEADLLGVNFLAMLNPVPRLAFTEYVEEGLLEWYACANKNKICQPTFEAQGDELPNVLLPVNSTAAQHWDQVCRESVPDGRLIAMPDVRFTVPKLSDELYSWPIQFCVPRSCLTYTDFVGPPADNAIMNQIALTGLPLLAGAPPWAETACEIMNATLSDVYDVSVESCQGSRLEFAPWLSYKNLAMILAALFVISGSLLTWVLLAKAPQNDDEAAGSLGGSLLGGASPLINDVEGAEVQPREKTNDAEPPEKQEMIEKQQVIEPESVEQENTAVFHRVLVRLARAFNPIKNFQSLFEVCSSPL